MYEIKQCTTDDRNMTHLEIDWDAAYVKAENTVLDDDDAPLLTKESLERSRPMHESLQKILEPAVVAEFLKRPGRPKQAECKEQVTIRLDYEVVSFFRSQGKGWQTKMNDVLKGYMDHCQHQDLS